MAVAYEYIKEPGRAHEVCKKLLDSKNVGTDTESTGLDPHKDKVTLLSLSSRKHGTFVVDTRDPKNLAAFTELFESEEVIKTIHNANHDYKLVKGTTGAEIENLICTFLGERTLTVGKQFGGLSLDAVTEKYLGIKRDKTLQKSFIDNWDESTEEQRVYAAEDAEYLLGIAEKQQEEARREGLLKTWRIESNAVQAFSDIEFYGQRIDKERWKKVMDQNLEAAEKAKQDLNVFFSPVCDRDLFGELDMNYESVPMVLSKLQMMGISVDGAVIKDTSKKTQKKIQDHPVIKALTRYREAMQGYKMFGDQYLRSINPKTGRVHFKLKQYGTDTGRPAAGGESRSKNEPRLNCLNIPRDLRYRECFGTEPGRLISTVDYSGAELRILAELSGDPLMVQGFNSGVDFHCFVASLLFNLEVTKKNENAKLRTPTKELNFGLAYGMGAVTLWEKLNGNGYKISLDDCKRLFDKYMRTFGTAIGWLKAQQREASTKFIMRNRNGRMRSFTPPNIHKIKSDVVEELRKRKVLDTMDDYSIDNMVRDKVKGQLAAIQREGANFNIQSVNADFTKVAMHRCRKAFKKNKWDARTYNSVYDEIVYDFAESYAEEAHELQKKIMVEAAQEMLYQVPMEVEGHLAAVWTK